MSFRTLNLLALCGLFACSDKEDTAADDTGHMHDDTGNMNDDTGVQSDLEITGSYTDGWGGDHEISNDTWSQYSGSTVFHLSQYDNANNVAIGQNDAANEYNPELWSRFDWTTDGAGQLWYCQTAYAAASEADALATAAADGSDPSTSGCGGFSWTSLTLNAR